MEKLLLHAFKIADVYSDGHFTLLKFTGNFRADFFTPIDRDDINKMPEGKTPEEAISNAFQKIENKLAIGNGVFSQNEIIEISNTKDVVRLETRVFIYQKTIILLDDDYDKRVIEWVGNLPESIRKNLVIANEHEGSLYLYWRYSVPEEYSQEKIVDVPDDQWTISRSELVC